MIEMPQIDAPLPARRNARDKELARRRRLRFSARLFAGLSLQDIAAQDNISMRRLNQLLDKWGLYIPRRQGCRPLAVVYVAGARAAWLDRLAAEAEVSPAEMAGRIIAVALADIPKTRRSLGKLALPTRGRG